MVDTIDKAARSRVMAAVKSKNTTPEMAVRRMVHSLGFRYRLHVEKLPGKPDLVLNQFRKIIDVRGCFWHLHRCSRCRIPTSSVEYWQAKLERNANRDRKVLRSLRQAGWRVLVIWECETRPDRVLILKSKILKFLTN